MERRFAREFLAELVREPRALKDALLSERARWLRGLRISDREDLLFELEMLLRAVELALERRHVSPDGRALLGRDFAEELRGIRDALHRATLVARRLTLPATEQSFQLRSYLERHAAEEARRPRMAVELTNQRTPDEGLYVLRYQLKALQGLADQLLRQDQVTFRAFDDYAVVAEYAILSNRYFRPPSALDFRTEYDRVGSVRLLDLVKRLSDLRARKALALGFLACFRLLRYLRFIPAAPTALPRRSLLIMLLVRDEAVNVTGYLTTDLRRLTSSAAEAALINSAAEQAAAELRSAVEGVNPVLVGNSVERALLEVARDALSEGAKTAASALAQAVEPNSTAAEIFDGQRARRERAGTLRNELWLFGQLLRDCLDELFPSMKGETTRAFDRLAALQRFLSDFRQVGYHLLRAGDHEPFDRFFSAFEALLNAAPSPARDRHLYLECRRFLTIVERGVALVNRRAELLGVPFDPAAAAVELSRFRDSDTLLETRPGHDPGAPPSPGERPPLHEPLEPTAADDEIAQAMLEMLGVDEKTPEPKTTPIEVEAPSLEPEPPPVPEPEMGARATESVDDDSPDPEDEEMNPEMTRRIWRGSS